MQILNHDFCLCFSFFSGYLRHCSEKEPCQTLHVECRVVAPARTISLVLQHESIAGFSLSLRKSSLPSLLCSKRFLGIWHEKWVRRLTDLWRLLKMLMKPDWRLAVRYSDLKHENVLAYVSDYFLLPLFGIEVFIPGLKKKRETIVT